MNKSQLVKEIASKADISQSDAEKFLESFMQIVSESLNHGDSISLVGFGTFSVKHRGARTGRNPRSGEEIAIAASNIPTFSAGKRLKDAVNSDDSDDPGPSIKK